MPVITLNKVVLPEPFGPMIPTIRSRSTDTSTPANRFSNPLISSAAIRGFPSDRSSQSRGEPAIDADQAGADTARQHQDHRQEGDAIRDARVDGVEVHDFREEVDDDRADQRTIEEAGAAEHDHQREIEDRKGTIEAGRNVAEIVELQDAGGTGERATDHEDGDLVKLNVDPDRSRQGLVLADSAQRPAVG